MTKLTKHELALAANMVLWFTNNSGEMGLSNLASLTGIDEDRLMLWAEANGYLWDDGETMSLSVLPIAWEAFACESRACQALYEAYLELKQTSKRGSPFHNWLRDCMNDCTLVA